MYNDFFNLLNFSKKECSEIQTTLDDCKTNELVKIISLKGGYKFKKRMVVLGLFKGQILKILNNSGYGPIIVELAKTRYVLGKEESKKIIIKILDK
jgi:Fe2+ transport system protein FeoA